MNLQLKMAEKIPLSNMNVERTNRDIQTFKLTVIRAQMDPLLDWAPRQKFILGILRMRLRASNIIPLIMGNTLVSMITLPSPQTPGSTSL